MGSLDKQSLRFPFYFAKKRAWLWSRFGGNMLGKVFTLVSWQSKKK